MHNKFFKNLFVLGTVVMSTLGMAACSDNELPIIHSNDGSDDNEFSEVRAVEKRSDMHIYVHYMPWFQTKAFSGAWGMHWTMDKCNPENVDANGKREIASHFYPLIGPYDSSDPLVLDYHALLMKYAGIEGVLVDWYGSRNGAESTEALMAAMKRAGLGLAIVYEDRNNLDGASSKDEQIKWGQDDMNYLSKNFFSQDNYIKVDGNPLLLCFGPIAISKENYGEDSPSAWSEIFSSLTAKKQKTCFLALYGASGNANDSRNTNCKGEFTWVNSENANFIDQLKKNFSVYMASAYPGFWDYYKEGGWGSSIQSVDYRNGQEFQDQLNVADSKKVPMLQLVTWNDFGEGTQIEPTQEDGYKYLEMVQKFAKVKYDKSVLESIYRLYTLRVKYSNDAEATKKLNTAYKAFAALRPEKAVEIMDGL